MAAPAAAAAPKQQRVTKRKEPEAEADREDDATRDYLLALSSGAAANLVLPSIPLETDDEKAIRELAEWVNSTADQQWALIHEWEAKLGITPPPHLLEPCYEPDPEELDDPDFSVLRPEGYQEKESKRRIGRNGLVRYLD